MKRLEDELRNALRHKEVPAGFAERVASRIFFHGLPERQKHRKKYGPFFSFPKIAWCAVAIVTCLAVFLGMWLRGWTVLPVVAGSAWAGIIYRLL